MKNVIDQTVSAPIVGRKMEVSGSQKYLFFCVPL